ncbi:DUF3710 domain-containing protein [Mobilicoccus caccae]|uniref:DUF3710 domain-containing protein n=1 Tax=Mobilicoccus caccae TaxID=1859295 RepID=A0ABQ6IPE7_9MICO|nr:DUF3710 domain-containing protein [Mobilicoccus caccae]GMA39759.1 hypothetical protein GCM10025883_18040 [Mobilicoccus caccae]
MAWFRRGKKSAEDEVDRTPSKAPAGAAPVDDTPDTPTDATTAAADEQAPASDHGPFDASDVSSDEGYLKLGSIWVPAIEGLMLTFEMDQSQSQVTAVQVVRGDSTLQLQAFAAPKSGGLWEEIRAEIAEGIAGQGATATEETGAHGTELVVDVNGGVMRFLGVDGPRWFLRGVVSGRAAVDPDAGAGLRQVFADVVVDRGGDPMGPRELLTLTLPDDSGQPDGSAEEEGRRASDLDPFTRGPEITEIR